MHQKYLEHVGKYDVLSREEEHELAVRMRNGDRSAREMLINSNQKFVIKIANQFTDGENLEDLVQTGNVGLIEGVDRYDPDLGYRLVTYANCRILKEIFDYYKKNGMIKLTAKKRELIKEAGRITQKMFAQNGEMPSPEEIAKILGPDYNGNDVRNAIEADRNSRTVSLSQHVGDEDSPELIDTIGIDRRDTIINEISSESTVEFVRKQILALNIREDIKLILFATLFEGKSFKQISEEMRVKTDYVKEKYKIGIRRLRNQCQKLKNT